MLMAVGFSIVLLVYHFLFRIAATSFRKICRQESKTRTASLNDLFSNGPLHVLFGLLIFPENTRNPRLEAVSKGMLQTNYKPPTCQLVSTSIGHTLGMNLALLIIARLTCSPIGISSCTNSWNLSSVMPLGVAIAGLWVVAPPPADQRSPIAFDVGLL